MYKKSILWYIYKKCDTKKSPRFSDITNSIFLYHKIDFLYKFFLLIWWYHKIVYVISKNCICDITKSRWFLILKHLFYDVTKYVEFLIDKIMTPVFYLRYFFYIPADTKFRACALIIFWELSLFQRTERQKRFLISHNRFIYIAKSEWFLISQNQFFDITNSI